MSISYIYTQQIRNSKKVKIYSSFNVTVVVFGNGVAIGILITS